MQNSLTTKVLPCNHTSSNPSSFQLTLCLCFYYTAVSDSYLVPRSPRFSRSSPLHPPPKHLIHQSSQPPSSFFFSLSSHHLITIATEQSNAAST